jgi:MSHA pilin protein MshD
MPIINRRHTFLGRRPHRGVSLIELIVFIVVVSIALTALLAVYIQSSSNSVDPIIRVRMLEAAQSKLDEIIALKYDEATPSGGIPACDSTTSTVSCTTSLGIDVDEDENDRSDWDDVDDFHNATDTPFPNYQRQVTVTTEASRKRITVTVSAPDGQTLTLAAYRYNF